MQNSLGCSLLLGGTALLISSIVSLHLPCLLTGLGCSLLSLLASPPLRNSFRALVHAMKDFSG